MHSDAALLTVVAATVAGLLAQLLAHSELTWQRDDQAVVLSRASEEETARLLDAVTPGRVTAQTGS